MTDLRTDRLNQLTGVGARDAIASKKSRSIAGAMKRTMMGMGTGMMGNRDGLGADGSIESSGSKHAVKSV